MDIELEFIKHLFHFKEIKNKKYNVYSTDLTNVYVFKNREEFKSYFTKNGVNVDNELLRLCTFKITHKGNILALKQLCDETIKKSKIYKTLSFEEVDEIHKRGNITFSEKVLEWEKYNICAPASKIRCNEFKNCHDCLTEYAADKNEYQKSKI